MGPQDYENKPGKFKVIGVDTFSHEDWLVGYYDTFEAAKNACPGGEMEKGYVYDDKGKCLLGRGQF